MRVQDLMRLSEVKTRADLVRVLKFRNEDGANAFWLAHGYAHWPLLTILVHREGTTLTDFPVEGHAGFSPAPRSVPDDRDTVKFAISDHPADDLIFHADSLVPWETAVAAAEQFLTSPDLPTCLDWMGLSE